MGGARQARGIGVKEMLTDTINVICLLPQEVGGSLYCPFVPSTFSPLALHGLRVWKKPRNCMEGEEAEGQDTQGDTVPQLSEKGFHITTKMLNWILILPNFTLSPGDSSVVWSCSLSSSSSLLLSASMVSGLFLK